MDTQEQITEPEVVEATEDVVDEAPSSRDALEAAFASVDDETAEEVSEEATEEVVEGEKAERERGEDGRFVAKEAKEGQETPEAPETPKSAAPERFSPEAKAEWEKSPEAVRKEAERAIAELTAGIQEKDTQLAPLQPFLKMASEQNADPAQVIDRYVAMERALYQNPVLGVTEIARNMGLTFDQFMGKLTGEQVQPNQQSQETMALRNEIDGLKRQLGQVTTSVTQQTQNVIQEQVSAFAAEKPRFTELQGDIARLLETGMASTLPEAYDMAERLKPAPVVEVEAPKEVAHTRPSRSLTSSPNGGSNPLPANPSTSSQEALSRAFDRVGF